MLKADFVQTHESFEAIGEDRGTGSDVLREEVGDRRRLEVRDDRHAEAPRGFPALLYRNQDECGSAPLELTAASKTSLGTTHPRCRRSRPRPEAVHERYSPSRGGACAGSSKRFRNAEAQADAGEAMPKHLACRWSSGRRPRTTGSGESWYCEGRFPR